MYPMAASEHSNLHNLCWSDRRLWGNLSDGKGHEAEVVETEACSVRLSRYEWLLSFQKQPFSIELATGRFGRLCRYLDYVELPATRFREAVTMGLAGG